MPLNSIDSAYPFEIIFVYVYSWGCVSSARGYRKILCGMDGVLSYVGGAPLKYESPDTVSRFSFLQFFITNGLPCIYTVDHVRAFKG